MHELHEIVHTAVGRAICGCWGPRDFNVWKLCEECTASMPWTIIATIAGPIFTFGLIWLGFYLMHQHYTTDVKSLGFALLFANMPLARIFTAAVGGGDEIYSLHALLGDQFSNITLWIAGLTIVLLLAVPPLIRAWNVLHPKNRIWVFSGFFILPFVLDVAVVLFGMNSLLEFGVLDQTGIIGSPLLLNLWTLLWIGMLLVFWKYLKQLLLAADHSR